MALKRTRKDFEADLQAQQSPYVSYGTPLPPLDPDVRDDGSYLPAWKQDAVDEQGRRRFHGAFTGGFSAGYFNTAGSKEGWTPSTFVSSRTNRSKDAKPSRPEDFMDDEDRSHAAEAQSLQTNQTFSAHGTTATDGRYQGFLMDLLRPQGETMGAKLLRRMGWRDGQGIGPKVKRVVGGNVNNANEHYFAPENTSIVRFSRKDDRKGLGFQGEAALGSSRPSKFGTTEESEGYHGNEPAFGPNRKEKQRPRKAGGIGTGILNDDDDAEDEDPYALGPRISLNKTIGGDKTKQKKKTGSATAVTTANPRLQSKPVFRSQKIPSAKSGSRKCTDGRVPLSGFTLSDSMASLDLSHDEMTFGLPVVPEAWQQSSTPLTDATSSYRSAADAAKDSTLDPIARAAMLGEQQLPGKSIFDFMSQAARERLVSATGRNDLPQARGEALPHAELGATQAHESEMPFVKKTVALGALGRGVGGWMPYSEDEPKRQRYRAFLEYHGEARPEPPTRPTGMDRDNWQRELTEFAHAADVFKPMSGVMASRFTSASSSSNEKGKATSTESESTPKAADAKLLDPAEEAARLGHFGCMTRSTHPFFPARLLCKRFNVKLTSHTTGHRGEEQPGQQGASNAVPPDSDRHLQGPVFQLTASQSQHSEMGSTNNGEPESAVSPKTSEQEQLHVDASHNEALEGQKAGEAVYQAIFGDDSDEDDE